MSVRFRNWWVETCNSLFLGLHFPFQSRTDGLLSLSSRNLGNSRVDGNLILLESVDSSFLPSPPLPLPSSENETELSLFNREAYEEFLKDPQTKWDSQGWPEVSLFSSVYLVTTWILTSALDFLCNPSKPRSTLLQLSKFVTSLTEGLDFLLSCSSNNTNVTGKSRIFSVKYPTRSLTLFEIDPQEFPSMVLFLFN